MVSELMKKYIWLIDTFLRSGRSGLLLEEIFEKWENRWGEEYSRRTFCNHRQAVEEVFGITISCDRSTNRYFIPSSEDVSDLDASSAWMINTFTVNNLLTMGQERLLGRVSVEDIPSGRKWLTEIMSAMEDNTVLKIAYRKYSGAGEDVLTVRPYAVKESERRWYLVGFSEERNAVRVYGLDRIMSIAKMDRTFRMPAGFDVDALFATSFGIYFEPEIKPVTIEFLATEKEASYLRDLPIHISQKETGKEGDRILFSILVVPNRSLVMEFCRRGEGIEVKSPVEVRRQVADALRAAAGLYE